jgi:two-component sensor histidine kinase
MALVHESIYRSDTIASVSAGDHFHSLVMELIGTFAPYTVITARVDAGDCQLNLEEAILYSLIVNELVTNAIKYAFEGRDRGTISVEMECGEKGKVLTVGDDGIGVSEDYRPGTSTSLGMNIVRNVVMHQLGGTIELVRNGGTSWVIRVPVRPPRSGT